MRPNARLKRPTEAEKAHDRSKERRQLEAIRGNAEKQMDLLRGGSDDKQADFYTYRYLATEGFLPGYNFPRLPLDRLRIDADAAALRHALPPEARFLAIASSARAASSTTRARLSRPRACCNERRPRGGRANSPTTSLSHL